MNAATDPGTRPTDNDVPYCIVSTASTLLRVIRLLTEDDPDKQAAAARLFEQVEAGAITMAAPDTVIADAGFDRLSGITRCEP